MQNKSGSAPGAEVAQRATCEIPPSAGSGKGVIFKKGVPIRNVLEADMVQALWEEVQRFDEDTPALESYTAKQKQKDAKKSALTVIS